MTGSSFGRWWCLIIIEEEEEEEENEISPKSALKSFISSMKNFLNVAFNVLRIMTIKDFVFFNISVAPECLLEFALLLLP